MLKLWSKGLTQTLKYHPSVRITVRRITSKSKTLQQGYTVTPSSHIDLPIAEEGPCLQEEARQCKLDFTDHGNAFRHMTKWELSRALIVLSACSYPSFAAHSLKLFELSERILGQRLTATLVRPLFYNQFIGGHSPDEIRQNMDRVEQAGSGYIIANVLEAIDSNAEALVNHETICRNMEDLARENSDSVENLMQIRMSALFPMSLLKKISDFTAEERLKFVHGSASYMENKGSAKDLAWLKSKLADSAEMDEILSGLSLLEDVGQRAVRTHTVLMVDAEYTHINPALTALTLALALRCNKQRPLVWNTTQCYLKSAYEQITDELRFCEEHGIHFGAKVVRGAYITPETVRSQQQGYPNPVHDSYEQTNQSYDQIVEMLLSKIHENKGASRQTRFLLASHNQGSIRQAVKRSLFCRMEELKIKREDNSVMFAQIYGMCDHITFTLSNAGYPVHKSIAVGSVSEALPYLSRRAQENTSVIINAREERDLLKKELRSRLMG